MKRSRVKPCLYYRHIRKACGEIAHQQWRDFFWKGEDFNKMCDVKQIQAPISERYKRNAAYQVNAALRGFMENVKLKFKELVYHSSIKDETRKHLFQINRRVAWMQKEHALFSPEELKLAHKIFKKVLSWRNKPDFSNQNMVLNGNVAQVIPADKTKATEFDYWIKLSTLESGKPILIPLRGNTFFNSRQGEIKQCVQINLTRDGAIKIMLIKDVIPRTIQLRTEKLSMDIGLKNLFALNTGQLYGRNFYDRLKHMDDIITPLAKNRQQQKLKTRSRRYNLLVQRLRDYLKNEICRILNRIIDRHAPKEIVIENLDFRNQNLSKRLNRLISKFGKRIIEQKIASISEEYGIKITKVNPAYTSQTCDSCGYVSKDNRTTQAKFECKGCHKKNNADVVASRNILVRSSDTEINVHANKRIVLSKLVMRYAERLPRPCSWANGLLSENPYFDSWRGSLRTA